MKTTIATAIRQSIAQSEIVRLTVDDIAAAAAEVSAQADDCVGAQSDIGLEIWGDVDGADFRLLISAN